MATTLRTPTRTVQITMTGVSADGLDDGVDYSTDYIGNLSDDNLHACEDDGCDLDGRTHYHCDDATADWWIKHCREMELLDNRIAELTGAQREQYHALAEEEHVYDRDAEDIPSAGQELLDRICIPAAASRAGRTLAKRGASKGGKASAAKLTPEERQARARRAIAARWAAKRSD